MRKYESEGAASVDVIGDGHNSRQTIFSHAPGWR